MRKTYRFPTYRFLFIYLLGMYCCFPSVSAQPWERVAADTNQVYTLPEVIISQPFYIRETRSATPLQELSGDRLRNLQVLQLSDAIKHFAGVNVKDYGGIGGLKTVSLRSLGAEHTAISYDGVTLTDVQTGQIDIGRFSLENVDRLSLSNGQSDQIFQAARQIASAGLLDIRTQTPCFRPGKNTHLSASFKTGSWGLIRPAIHIEQRLSRQWSAVVSSEGMTADGRYRYTQHYGQENDSTSREKRKNTQVHTFRTEASVIGQFSSTEQWRIKAYYYQSSRGLPGATTLYYDHAAQHLWDKNLFLQSHYKKEFNAQWAFQILAKWNWNYQRYLDPDTQNTAGATDNSYYQQEYYLSATALYRPLERISFSVATDGSIQSMNADLPDFASPTRYTSYGALSGKYAFSRLTASASVLATLVHDRTSRGESAGTRHRLTPYASLTLKPLAAEELHIRFFYKEIFRMPTFNDLYYGEIGHTGLLPERTRQYNAGITWSRSFSGPVSFLSATADGYYNRVSDKILAIPTKNIFIWSMINLGEVDIKGIDVTASLRTRSVRRMALYLSGNYSYQRALDSTDPTGKTYKHQIAYTPRVSGSGQAGIETPWIHLSYSLLHSGKRYMLGQNLTENRLTSYTDHSISARRDFTAGESKLSLSVEVLNLADKNYEIVKNFPMPGRSVRATLQINY